VVEGAVVGVVMVVVKEGGGGAAPTAEVVTVVRYLKAVPELLLGCFQVLTMVPFRPWLTVDIVVAVLMDIVVAEQRMLLRLL
jgi:hypothetical protein